MAVQPSSRRRRWTSLAVLAVLAVVVLLLLARRESNAPGDDAVAPARPAASTPPQAGSASRAVAPQPPSPETAPSPEPAPALAAFTGRIVSAEDGRPVVGAEVTFLAPEGATSVRSGADG